MPAQCSSCQAKIGWALTVPGGKRIPVDMDSRGFPGGDVLVFWLDGQHYAVALPKNTPDGELGGLPVAQFARYTSHWVTCLSRDQHREAGA